MTCGIDKTIKIWNILTKAVDISVKFDEDVFSVALHPSGLFASIGYAAKVKLVNIVNNGIIPYYEFPIKVFQRLFLG